MAAVSPRRLAADVCAVAFTSGEFKCHIERRRIRRLVRAVVRAGAAVAAAVAAAAAAAAAAIAAAADYPDCAELKPSVRDALGEVLASECGPVWSRVQQRGHGVGGLYGVAQPHTSRVDAK